MSQNKKIYEPLCPLVMIDAKQDVVHAVGKATPIKTRTMAEKKKGPKFNGAEKMRDFYYSVIKKPLNEGERKKLKDVFGKKEEIK